MLEALTQGIKNKVVWRKTVKTHADRIRVMLREKQQLFGQYYSMANQDAVLVATYLLGTEMGRTATLEVLQVVTKEDK